MFEHNLWKLVVGILFEKVGVAYARAISTYAGTQPCMRTPPYTGE